MSKAPEKLPNRTRVLVKDILFQEKYRLSHTQIDIMAYIINCLTWTLKVGAFFPVTNKKFHQDLPQISEKTIEESLRALKAMELIEVQMITVPKWDNAYVRGVSVLPKGLEYNASFYKADEQVIIDNLKEQMRTRDQELLELREQLKNIKAVEVPKEFQDEKEAQIIEEAIEKDDDNNYDDLGFKELITTVTKEFGATSEPICNAVNGWQKETEFYINSYNKLTVVNPSGQVAQLKNPIEIGNFWKYISDHREQIGKVIDFTQKLDVDELNMRYAQMDIVLKDTKFKVQKIEEVKNGVQVSIRNSENGNRAMLSKDGEAIVFEVEACEKVLLGLRGGD